MIFSEDFIPVVPEAPQGLDAGFTTFTLLQGETLRADYLIKEEINARGDLLTYAENQHFRGTLHGTADQDAFYLDGITNKHSIVGGNGNDYFHAFYTEHQSLYGGNGNDTFDIDSSNIHVFLGNDR